MPFDRGITSRLFKFFFSNHDTATGVGGGQLCLHGKRRRQSVYGLALMSDATTGKRTGISDSPYNTGSGSAAVQADPTGKFLYVANRVSGDISGFTITATTGALTPMAAPFPVEFGVDAIAIDPTGKFLYSVSAQSNNLRSFQSTAPVPSRI
jgi:DNA-binding beta-propeller fold protein YncE